MAIHITGAPCCWGVDDVKNPYLPKWQTVLEEAGKAGFRAIELGPYGYLPLDIDLVSAALKKNGISIVAGTIFDDLVAAENRENLLRQVDDICGIITKLPPLPREEGQRRRTPYLTVMDWGHDERDYAAGHSDRAPRLSDEDRGRMMEHIRAIAEKAATWGVRAVIHPHAGGYIEFADEIDRLAKEKNRIMFLSYGYCGHQMIEQARRMVASGDLGPIRILNMQFAHGAHNVAVEKKSAATAWRVDPKKAGLSYVLGDVGTHMLYLQEAIVPQLKIRRLMCWHRASSKDVHLRTMP